jgi:putative Ca2+/H+ antiporter (TMEM165/GDT1 family)
MEALLVSLAVVAVAEIGDKTQLLALLLAARFRRPLPIVLGILTATLANHTLAGLAGAWVRHNVPPEYLRWLLAVSFLAVAVWALVPDREQGAEAELPHGSAVFAATFIAFFLTEIGDKTQIATVMLAAQFDNLVSVVAGTTLGMLAADVPAVYFGRIATARIPLRAVRMVAAALFAVLALAALFVS